MTKPGGEFTDADYAKIKQIDNVDKIVEYDLLLDLVTNVTDDSEKGEYYVTTKLGEAADYADQLEEGRMPKKQQRSHYDLPAGPVCRAIHGCNHGQKPKSWIKTAAMQL